jgi:hypothetical protein
MHPQIVQAVAAEHVRDLVHAGDRARLARGVANGRASFPAPPRTRRWRPAAAAALLGLLAAVLLAATAVARPADAGSASRPRATDGEASVCLHRRAPSDACRDVQRGLADDADVTAVTDEGRDPGDLPVATWTIVGGLAFGAVALGTFRVRARLGTS